MQTGFVFVYILTTSMLMGGTNCSKDKKCDKYFFIGRKTKRFFCGMGKCRARCLLTKRYGKREIKTE